MTIDRMIELLKIERECMLRGAHDVCDRNCAECQLVQDDYELNEMYINVINLLQEREQTRLDIAHDMITGSILMYQGKELVRCKDCKHGKSRKNANGEDMIDCLLADNWLKHPDWFCADGVKKDA